MCTISTPACLEESTVLSLEGKVVPVPMVLFPDNLGCSFVIPHLGAKPYASERSIPTQLPMRIISRSDIVGQYHGHTDVKTQQYLAESPGGVIFIDEAHSPMEPPNDSFSMEALDTICQFLDNPENNYPFITLHHELRYPPASSGRFCWNFGLYDKTDVVNQNNSDGSDDDDDMGFGLFD